MCLGGGDGGRALTDEEKDLIKMQTRTAEQGLQGRDEAMGGYRGFTSRGREMGSVENMNLEGDRALSSGLANAGRLSNMRRAQMASMGVNPNDARFQNAEIAANVDQAASLTAGANNARNQQRSAGLQLEGAGYSGLGGFDPTGALNGLSSTLAGNRASGDAAAGREAQGWGNLATAGMYGLKNGKAISEGFNSFFGGGGSPGFGGGSYGSGEYLAHGGLVRDVHLASGGNVYDQAMQQAGVGQPMPSQRAPSAPSGGGIDPITATRIASTLVNKASATPAAYQMAVPGLTSSAPGSQAAMLAEQTGAFGLPGLTSTASAGAGAGAGAATLGAEAAGTLGAEAAGTALAAEAGVAGAAGAATLGAAVPVLGLAMLANEFFASGGNVPAIGGRTRMMAGRAANPAGGKVRGPGGPKDDKVPAWLSPGEFVMPVEAVHKYGLDRLESMRRKALEPNRGRA